LIIKPNHIIPDTNLQRALEIAVESHRNQKQKDGTPYALHPIRLSTSTMQTRFYRNQSNQRPAGRVSPPVRGGKIGGGWNHWIFKSQQ
jgi:hypothetical protein